MSERAATYAEVFAVREYRQPPPVRLLSLRGALLVNAATFLVCALLIARGVRARPAPRTPLNPARRARADGLRLVFADPWLRAYVLVLWTASAFTYAAEGLMAPLAGQYDGDSATVGLLLAAAPTGMALGGVALTRLCPPAARPRLIRPWPRCPPVCSRQRGPFRRCGWCW
ncbi:hypothetical protein ACLQ24_28810 [Micromonospora sp. DT4]|uniref:hypothetical protein n=1 Tax=Micromonospora sp. DT4 TaxID=3393438 RepID=UPI003CF18A33